MVFFHLYLRHAVDWSDCNLLAVVVHLNEGEDLVGYGGGHDPDDLLVDVEHQRPLELRATHHSNFVTKLSGRNAQTHVMLVTFVTLFEHETETFCGNKCFSAKSGFQTLADLTLCVVRIQ